jgi:beta-mannosidase
VGITHLRSLHDLCSGSVVWQLNDCWPSISWSLVDVAGRPKLSWYAVRSAYRDRLAAFAIDPDTDGRPHVALVNDRPEPWRAQGALRRLSVEGTVLASLPVDLVVPARGAAKVAIPDDLGTPGDRRRELLVLDVDATRDTWWFADDAEIALAPPRLEVSVRATDDGARVEVRAVSLARELCLQPDHVSPEARVDRALVTLLPGERTTFQVTGSSLTQAQLAGLGRAPALRAANDPLGRDRRVVEG